MQQCPIRNASATRPTAPPCANCAARRPRNLTYFLTACAPTDQLANAHGRQARIFYAAAQRPRSHLHFRPSMPRRVFKPLSRQRHRWKERWFLRPFRIILEHPVYWALNRRNVTRAFALGLFIAFVPLPLHFALGTIAALVLRLNVPAVLAGTLLTNPFTFV